MSAQIELWVEEGGERLDAYLADQLEDLSRSRIQKLIEQQQVVVNGLAAAKKTLVRPGDRVQVTIPEAEPLEIQPENISLEILYEDAHLLILNKPVSLVVHPAPGHSSGTLVNALLWHCRSETGESTLSGIGGVQRPGIVHRLDKDTSGAIAVAKTDLAHQQLQTQFQQKTAKRDYLGVVYGVPMAEQGTVDLPIGRHPVDRKKMAIVPESEGGRHAITHWQTLERLGNYTLVQFALETGRTHQIRVHAAHLGHPIVGDLVYGSGRSIGVNLPGQALHAWKLRLFHPVSGEAIAVTAPPPQSFVTLLEVLRRRMS